MQLFSFQFKGAFSFPPVKAGPEKRAIK